jgi:hypothetical protein
VMGAVSVLMAANQMDDIRNFRASNPPAADFSQLQTSLQAQNQLINGLTGFINSSASLVAANFTFDASMAEAEAQRARTEGDYQQALGQNEQTFMQQLADAIRALLSGWGSIEQSTHEAYGATYRA